MMTECRRLPDVAGRIAGSGHPGADLPGGPRSPGFGDDGLLATDGTDQVRPSGRGPSCHDRDMTGRNGGAEIVEFGSVPGFVVFDLPGARLSAGGTRLAPDVSVAEVAVLARSMTYKFAALGERVGGAKAGVRGDPADLAGQGRPHGAVLCGGPAADRRGPVPDRAGHGHGRGGLRAAAPGPGPAPGVPRHCGWRAVPGPAHRVRRHGGGRDGPGQRGGRVEGLEGVEGP